MAIAIAAGVAIGSDGSLSWAAGPSEVVKVDPKSFALRMESYGSGTVNPGAGQYQFPDGTEITLQAVADYPDIGIRWMVDGVGSWSNECRLAMNQDHHVEVWFEERPRHSADTQWDWEFQLSELLRVIQCYTALGIRCAELSAPTEDGYRPGTSGSTNCAPHSSDYYPQDWTIDLGELLRLIQFYNAPGFDVCADSEDGFCAIE
ncbi:MAG: hypothetical protein IT368_16000 [Candidatus Hydrogenedentes bacterium]|nr:hypothetical protein [Candidatus Hydrogenedentota bacterium]